MERKSLLIILFACLLSANSGLQASTLPFGEGEIAPPPLSGDSPFAVQTTIPAVIKEVETVRTTVEKLIEDKNVTTEEVVAAVKVTIKSGDTLWKIAQELLGDGNRYKELIEANKDKYPSLEKNPDLIHAGWELTIPGQEPASSDQEATVTAAPVQSVSSETVKIDASSSSTPATIVQVPQLTTEQKIKGLQKAVDAANRALLAQKQKIGALTPSTIRFLIKNSFLSEEEWMAMNPPSGYHWSINSRGEVSLTSDSTQKEMTDDQIAKLDSAEKQKAYDEAVKKAKADKEAKEKAKKDADKKAQAAQAEKDKKDKAANEAEQKAKAEQEAAEKAEKEAAVKAEAAANAQYTKILNEIGVPDLSKKSKDYRKAVNAGSKLMSKGFFGGTTSFFKFVNSQDYPYYNIPALQEDLKAAQEKYEKLVDKNKTDRFLGIFGSTIESAGKQVAELKTKLEKAWGEMKKALDDAKARASELSTSISSAKSEVKALNSELSKLDKYDSANSKKVQDLQKKINELNETVEDSQEKLDLYDSIKGTFGS